MAIHANSIPAPIEARPQATDERFEKWWAAILGLDTRISALDPLNDDAVSALCAEQRGYEARIAAHDSAGPGGVLIKARLIHRAVTIDLDPFLAGLAAEVVAHLEARS